MFSTALSVGNRRPQKGHSKSENSMIVTGAVAGPRAGKPAVAISVRGGAWAIAVGIGRTAVKTEVKTEVKTAEIAEIMKRISFNNTRPRSLLLSRYQADQQSDEV